MTAAATSTGELSPKIASIRAYGAAGYCLIPLRGKIPTIKDWGEVAPGHYNETNLADRNYGVALRAGDLVIDIDPRNFAKDDRPVKRLIEAIGAPLSSYTVRTGGGGLHVYFRKPPDLLVVGQLKEFPGVEFKSSGRQVVGPGSIHPETAQAYTVVDGTGGPSGVADAPEGLLALVKKTAVPFVEVQPGVKEYVNDANTQGRYARYLQDSAEPSVEGRHGDENAFKVACHGRDLGLPPATTWELMLEYWNKRCQPPWGDEELKTKVINAYTHAQGAVGSASPQAQFEKVDTPIFEGKKEDEIDWVLTNQGGIVKNFQNLLNYLRLPGGGLDNMFGYNQFTEQVEFVNPAPWHFGHMPSIPTVHDDDLKMLKGYLATKHGFEMPVFNIEEAVTITARRHKFHPVREYLKSLKWDGVKRLDYWLKDYLGVEDNAYTRACARKTLCAAVMRIMKPGVKFDHVLVLEGAQDIGKSSVCLILAGKWGGDFPIDPHSKDTVDLMQGTWIVELAELEVFKRTEMDALKAFITRTHDKARLAYGRRSKEFPRQSIFIASKNPSADGTYLIDETGNRRWWPVACLPNGGQVDFTGLKKARNQLFAEAMNAAQGPKGEPLYMESQNLKTEAKKVVDLRHAQHPWTEPIARWLEGITRVAGAKRDFLTGNEIFTDAMGGVDRVYDRKSAISIARVMRDLGWAAGTKRMGLEGNERMVRGYIAPRLNPNLDLGDLV